MKITIVLGAFFPVPPVMGGAVEKVWFALSQEFVRRGHEVIMISRAYSAFPKREQIAGVQHIRIRGFDQPGSLLWLKLLDLLYSLRGMAVLPKADIVVTNTFWLPILLRNSSHGQVYVHAVRYPKGQMRFYGRAARLQAPSHSVARAITKEAPKVEKKIAVIPNPVPDATSGTEPPNVSQREKIMLFVGRLHPEKGLHLLIDGFAQGAQSLFRHWKLMIVGPAEERFGGGGSAYLSALRRSADQASGQIILTGPLFDSAKLAKTMRTARLFVYPSLAERGESFGLAPLEAMAQGCAVLVSNLDCFHDFIRDGETGFVFDHLTANPTTTLQEKIAKLISDETLLARVAEAGYRKSAEYSVANVASQFLNDFNSLVGTSNVGNANR